MRAFVVGCVIVAAVLATVPSLADDDVVPEEAKVLAGLHFQTGHIKLPSGVASLDVPQGYVYLDPADTEALLTKVWANPRGSGKDSDGMLLKPSEDSNDIGVLFEYDNSGHVSDSDSQSINYVQLLSDMQRAAVEENDERQKEGFEPVQLLGWAEPPHYNSADKTLYWAKRLRFGDQPEMLNYFVRVLGRSGVMDLNVIAGMDQLQRVDAKVPTLLHAVAFNPGSTYADFKPGSDNVAAYGIAGLIAGGILVKAGFLKGLLVLAAAFWKVIAVAVIAGFATLNSFLRRLFRRNAPGQ